MICYEFCLKSIKLFSFPGFNYGAFVEEGIYVVYNSRVMSVEISWDLAMQENSVIVLLQMLLIVLA